MWGWFQEMAGEGLRLASVAHCMLLHQKDQQANETCISPSHLTTLGKYLFPQLVPIPFWRLQAWHPCSCLFLPVIWFHSFTQGQGKRSMGLCRQQELNAAYTALSCMMQYCIVLLLKCIITKSVLGMHGTPESKMWLCSAACQCKVTKIRGKVQ